MPDDPYDVFKKSSFSKMSMQTHGYDVLPVSSSGGDRMLSAGSLRATSEKDKVSAPEKSNLLAHAKGMG